MTPPDLRGAKVISEAPPASSSSLAGRLVTVDAEWITEALPPREHLLTDRRTGRGALDKIGVWLLAAAGGAGKSYASIDLALAVAAGGRWVGTFETSGRPGRALLVVAEDSADDVRRRLKSIADTSGHRSDVIAGRIQVLPLAGTFTSLVRLDRTLGTYVMGEGLSELRELIEAQRAPHGPFGLVVIDPVSRVAGVSVDKDSEAASKVIDALDVLAAAAGGLVLGVLHTNKSSRKETADGKRAEAVDVRGSSALTDGARGVISLVPLVDAERKPTGRIVLSLAKANHVGRWDDVILQRHQHGVLVPLDEVDRAIYEGLRRGQTPQERDAARAAEREARAAADLDRAAAVRSATIARKDAAAQARVAADALVVRQVIADGGPGKLRDLVKARLACGSERADRAIARVQDEDSGARCPDPNPPHTPPVPGGTEAPVVPSGASADGGTEAHRGTTRHPEARR